MTSRERLHQFQTSNVDQVILLNQAGKHTHEDICTSLELFAAELLPALHDDAAQPPHGKQEGRRGPRGADDIFSAASPLAPGPEAETSTNWEIG